MSTRARIALALTNGKFKSIYVHKDGYPEGVGQVLAQHYCTPARVKALLALGDLSRLNPQLAPPVGLAHAFGSPLSDVTVAYKRDRGDKGTAALTSINIKSLAAMAIECNAEYLYVFGEGRWQFVALPIALSVDLPSLENLQELASCV